MGERRRRRRRRRSSHFNNSLYFSAEASNPFAIFFIYFKPWPGRSPRLGSSLLLSSKESPLPSKGIVRSTPVWSLQGKQRLNYSVSEKAGEEIARSNFLRSDDNQLCLEKNLFRASVDFCKRPISNMSHAQMHMSLAVGWLLSFDDWNSSSWSLTLVGSLSNTGEVSPQRHPEELREVEVGAAPSPQRKVWTRKLAPRTRSHGCPTPKQDTTDQTTWPRRWMWPSSERRSWSRRTNKGGIDPSRRTQRLRGSPSSAADLTIKLGLYRIFWSVYVLWNSYSWSAVHHMERVRCESTAPVLHGAGQAVIWAFLGSELKTSRQCFSFGFSV